MVATDIQRRGRRFLGPVVFVASCLVLWQLLSPLFPPYVLPSPLAIGRAFVDAFPVIMMHSWRTLAAALLGLSVATALALVCAFVMDMFQPLYELLYPLAVVSQTIPLIAVAPLFVLWFGFGILPKLLAVVLVCFFPVLINVLKSFRALERNYVDLMRSMGAGRWQIVRHVKLPGTVPAFFAGMRIAATYAVLGAVIGEWLGGSAGLGVYIIRSQKSFAAARLFAGILMIIVLSVGLFSLVLLAEYRVIRKRTRQNVE